MKKKSIKIHIHQTKIENDCIRFLMFEILSFQKNEPGYERARPQSENTNRRDKLYDVHGSRNLQCHTIQKSTVVHFHIH